MTKSDMTLPLSNKNIFTLPRTLPNSPYHISVTIYPSSHLSITFSKHLKVHQCTSFNIQHEVKVKESEVAQSCPTLCDPMDCGLPGSSIHGIFQARILEWVAISFILLNRDHYLLTDFFFLSNTVSIYKMHKSQIYIP